MLVEDMNINEFIESLKKGSKQFKEVAVEDYNFTLRDSILNDVEFISSFVNFHFKNCSLRGAKFIDCNLKCISFDECDLTGILISECAIESMEIRNCNLNEINFGTNYAYGNTLSGDRCFEIYKYNNAT